MDSPEYRLMQSIRQRWWAQISVACVGSALPESFLAALIANETGGDPTRTRFEASAFRDLCLVAAGKKASMGLIGGNDIVPHETLFTPKITGIVALATSYGLTQIMGYQAIARGRDISILQNPPTHLQFAVTMLDEFRKAHNLQFKAPIDYEPLFACWNSGQPDPSRTFDPKYCPNGVARMELYGNGS